MPAMLRTLVVVAVLLALLHADTAAARCLEGSRVIRTENGDRVRTAVVLCREGRRSVARRAVLRRGRPERGELITGAASAAGRLAIGSIRARPGRDLASVELRSVRTGRRLFRREQLLRESAFPAAVDVVVADRGELGWTFGRQVFLRRVSGRVVRLAAGGAYELGVDDGRTLRWGPTKALDLRPLPVRDGCPVRGRFRPLLEQNGVLLTAARFGPRTVVRACVRGSDRDRILGAGFRGEDTVDTFRVLAASTPFVLVQLDGSDRHIRCTRARLVTVDVRDGRMARAAETTYDRDGECVLRGLAPRRSEPVAITSAGAPAWVRDGVLRAVNTAGTIVELDRGAITDLRADGELVRWRSAGVDREARL